MLSMIPLYFMTKYIINLTYLVLLFIILESLLLLHATDKIYASFYKKSDQS